MKDTQNFAKLTAVLLMATTLSGCNAWTRIKNIGAEPPLTPIENPVEAPDYKPVSMPMPEQTRIAGQPSISWVLDGMTEAFVVPLTPSMTRPCATRTRRTGCAGVKRR